VGKRAVAQREEAGKAQIRLDAGLGMQVLLAALVSMLRIVDGCRRECRDADSVWSRMDSESETGQHDRRVRNEGAHRQADRARG